MKYANVFFSVYPIVGELSRPIQDVLPADRPDGSCSVPIRRDAFFGGTSKSARAVEHTLPVFDGRRALHPTPFDVGHEPGIGLEVADTPVLEIPDKLEQCRGVLTARLIDQGVEACCQVVGLFGHQLKGSGQPLVVREKPAVMGQDQPAGKKRELTGGPDKRISIAVALGLME